MESGNSPYHRFTNCHHMSSQIYIMHNKYNITSCLVYNIGKKKKNKTTTTTTATTTKDR
jgi:hypothetical protein